MAQAKLMVSSTQAKALGLLVYYKYPILYDPKSGVNLKETKAGQSITVKDGADITNLKRFQEAGYFSVIEGTVLPHSAAFSSISINGFTLTLTFSGAVTAPILTSTANGAATDDIILRVKGVATAATFGAINGVTTITATVENINEDVSVQITQHGASKIMDARKSAILPLTKTYSIAPIFQSISVGGVGNTLLSLNFNESVYTAGVSSTNLGDGEDDLIILVDGVATPLTIGAVLKAAATNQLTVDMGSTPATSISVQITEAGVAKLLDTDDTAVGGVLTRTYAINTGNAITAFSFEEQTGPAVIDAGAHTVAIEVEYDAVLTALVPIFTLSTEADAKIGAVVQESGVTANDFTNPVSYIVTSQSGADATYIVTVTVKV